MCFLTQRALTKLHCIRL